MKLILWADEPNNAIGVRDELKQKGHQAMIRDARAFQGSSDAERCDAIAFISASKRDEIVACYSSPGVQERLGRVQIYDIATGDFGEPLSVPDVGTVTSEPVETEADLLDKRLENLSDADLRTYARAVVKTEIPADASREDIEALLRQGKPAEGKPSPEGVTVVADPAAAAEPAQVTGAAGDVPPVDAGAKTEEPPRQEDDGKGKGSRPPRNKPASAAG